MPGRKLTALSRRRCSKARMPKRSLWLCFAAAVCIVFVCRGEAMEVKVKEDKQDQTPVYVEIEDVGNIICPVFNGLEPVDPRYTSVYKGKRYYFCCEECVKYFEENLEISIEKLKRKEQEADQKEKSESGIK